MSNLLKQRCSLTKLREELEGRKGKLCRCCKKFRHLACNCRNVKKERGKAIPLNKFKILSSRVMQSGDKGRIIRRVEVVVVECYECGEKEHKCREYLLWEKKAKRVVCPVKGKVYQRERRVRRVEEEEVACVAKPQEVQQGREEAWRRSLAHVL